MYCAVLVMWLIAQYCECYLFGLVEMQAFESAKNVQTRSDGKKTKVNADQVTAHNWRHDR